MTRRSASPVHDGAQQGVRDGCAPAFTTPFFAAALTLSLGCGMSTASTAPAPSATHGAKPASEPAAALASSALPDVPAQSSASEQDTQIPPSTITVAVPDDAPVEVVLGPPDSPHAIIYLHGFCGDPYAFEGWSAAATQHGTLISMRGDLKCKKRRGRRRWSYRFELLRQRIDAALDAVDGLRASSHTAAVPAALAHDNVTLIGYSQGAKRVASLGARYPERFQRLAIIAIAAEPSAAKLRRVPSVLLMAGARDARKHIKEGYAKLRKMRRGTENRRVRYLELPDAAHGEYGPQALPVMTEGLDWLFLRDR